MKYVIPFFVLLGVVALAYEQYVLGVAIIVFVAFIQWAVSFLAGKVMEVYAQMPRYGLDISETLALAKDSWFFRKGVNFSSLAFFYTVLMANSRHFDVKVNVGLIDAFEHNHRFLRLHKTHHILPIGKAVYYYAITKCAFPTIWMLHIARAIIVTKKPGATKQQAEGGIIPNFFKLILRWLASP